MVRDVIFAHNIDCLHTHHDSAPTPPCRPRPRAHVCGVPRPRVINRQIRTKDAPTTRATTAPRPRTRGTCDRKTFARSIPPPRRRERPNARGPARIRTHTKDAILGRTRFISRLPCFRTYCVHVLTTIQIFRRYIQFLKVAMFFDVHSVYSHHEEVTCAPPTRVRTMLERPRPNVSLASAADRAYGRWPRA